MFLPEIQKQVEDEFIRATAKYGPFNSEHEGYAVLLEEVDELWAEIKKRPDVRSTESIRHEAVQVAAMAMRLLHDCI